jgi:quercetin dioxygenase-like cupin family protein
MTAPDIGPAGPAEMLIPCSPLAPTLDFFLDLGFRVEAIFPADAPHTASLSGHGLRLRLAPGDGAPGVIRLACERWGEVLIAPNGTRVELIDPDPPVVIPPLQPQFLITRREDGPAEGVGRAGMIYRDLIPGRLGGRYIASHIALPLGGPVADWVHFHKISFQMIVCRRGWARLVYEDQGSPFLMEPGDVVLQPPRIRHRVLETSAGFEVVEIGCPALHETLADHALALPTGRTLPQRDFSGQVFRHHRAAEAQWTLDGGMERQDTGLAWATGGLADAYVLRPAEAGGFAPRLNDGELLFGFMLEGSAVLQRAGAHPLGPADAFVIPKGDDWGLRACSPDARVLVVVAPSGAQP